MNYHLREIAEIRTGVYARQSDAGEVVYLQARDMGTDGHIFYDMAPRVKSGGISERHYLREGEILLTAKGLRNVAAVCAGRIGPVIVSSSFFVVTIKAEFDKRILPDYVCWFMNHPRTQTILKSLGRGTSVRSISLRLLGQLEIQIPDLPTQSAILEAYRLAMREKRLHTEIGELKESLAQRALIRKTQQQG